MRTRDSIALEMIAPCEMDRALCMKISRKMYPRMGCSGPDKRRTTGKMIAWEQSVEDEDGILCLTCGFFPCKSFKDLDGRYRKRYSKKSHIV